MRKIYQYGRGDKYSIYKKLINSWKWQVLRKKKFIANPVCEECKKNGRVSPTEEIHHVVPVESGKDESEMKQLAYDYNNLRALCKACHAAAHAPKIGKDDAKDFFDKFFA